jgi:hypothetical protein
MLKRDWLEYTSKNAKGFVNPDSFVNPADQSKIKIQLMLEILEGCAYNCSGCFVKRRKNYGTGLGLDLAAQLVDELTEQYVLDDIIVGPTDFFSSGNIIQVLDDPRFRKIVDALPPDGGLQHNCSIDFFIGDDRVEQVIKHVENSFLRERPFDVQIAVDLHMLDNSNVHSLIEKRLAVMEQSLIEYEVSLLCNITQQVDDDVLDKVERVREKWGTVVEWGPSLVRAMANKPDKMLSMIQGWNSSIQSVVDKDEQRFKENFIWQQSDNSHKNFNEVIITVNNDKLYIVPFLYENSPIYHDSLEVPIESSVLTSILNKKHNLQLQQYKNIPNLVCNNCEYVENCNSRLIQTLMSDVIQQNKCLINKNVMALYNNMGYNQ